MFEFIEYIGVIAFAISGFLVAIKHNLDLLGVFVSSFLTALGGGVIRDILVDKTPYSFTHNTPALIVLIVITILIISKPYKKSQIEDSFLYILSDSLGLASFSISGGLIAINSNFNLTGVLATSFIAAVGGGITRDIIINEVPQIFKTSFYGTVSILIALMLYIFNSLNLLNIYTITLSLLFGTSLRVLAYYKSWNLPKV